MTHEFDVPGYITPDEFLAKQTAGTAEQLTRANLEKDELTAKVQAKVELAKTSIAPHNCVIENWSDTGASFFAYLLFNERKAQLVSSLPAWYLGGWITFGDYVGTDSPRFFAFDNGGIIYESKSEIGRRREFKIGKIPHPTYHHDIRLGERTMSLPDEVNFLRDLDGLPGWEVIEQNQPTREKG